MTLFAGSASFGKSNAALFLNQLWFGRTDGRALKVAVFAGDFEPRAGQAKQIVPEVGTRGRSTERYLLSIPPARRFAVLHDDRAVRVTMRRPSLRRSRKTMSSLSEIDNFRLDDVRSLVDPAHGARFVPAYRFVAAFWKCTDVRAAGRRFGSDRSISSAGRST